MTHEGGKDGPPEPQPEPQPGPQLGPALGPEGLERARRFITLVPHARALGITLDAVGEGWAELSMPWDARFVGDPHTQVIHGGAVSALMDTCCGTAVLSLPGTAGTATIDLRIDYMRPATPRQRITARAECYHVTRAVVFVRATATDADAARPVAMATGTFTLERAAVPAASAVAAPEAQP